MPQARKTAPKTVATTVAQSASSSAQSSRSETRSAASTVVKIGRPSREAIAHRAYELYLQRGSESGFELEDWLSAEAELTAAAALAAGDSDASR